MSYRKARRRPSGKFLVARASSTGGCNTIQCIDSTMLARENHSPAALGKNLARTAFRQHPRLLLSDLARDWRQRLAVGTGRTYRQLIGHTPAGPRLAILHS